MSTPIERSDIRLGDYILATTMDDGVLVERRGKVETISQFGTLGNHAGGYIHNPSWAGKFTFQLIDRPKPKLPTEAGARIIATKVRGEVGNWLAARVDGRWWTLGYAGGFGIHDAHDIEAWTLAKVVEA